MAKRASADVVGALLAAHPAGAKAWNNFGRLPLHLAVCDAAPVCAATVDQLLAAYKIGASELDETGRTPAQWAQRTGADAAVVAKLAGASAAGTVVGSQQFVPGALSAGVAATAAGGQPMAPTRLDSRLLTRPTPGERSRGRSRHSHTALHIFVW